jgi:hypothetical protein
MRLGWLTCGKARHCYQLVTIKAARPLRLFQAGDIKDDGMLGDTWHEIVLDLFSRRAICEL